MPQMPSPSRSADTVQENELIKKKKKTWPKAPGYDLMLFQDLSQ